MESNLTSPSAITESPLLIPEAPGGFYGVAIDEVNTIALSASSFDGNISCTIAPLSMSGLSSQAKVLSNDAVSITPECVLTFDLTGYNTSDTYWSVGVLMTDVDGDSSMADIVLISQAPPMITACAPQLTQLNPGQPDDTTLDLPDFTGNVTVDSQAAYNVTQSPEPGTTVPSGAIIHVTLNATNGYGSDSCTTTFVNDVDPNCLPYFSHFPDDTTVDYFQDHMPAVIGYAKGASMCSGKVNVTYFDLLVGTPGCVVPPPPRRKRSSEYEMWMKRTPEYEMKVIRTWVVKDGSGHSASQNQSIEFTNPDEALFGAAAPFQLYTTGSMSITSGSIYGQVAAATSLTAKNTGFGKGSTCTWTEDTLVAGSISATGSQVWFGDAAYSSSVKSSSSSPFTSKKESPVSFGFTSGDLRALAARLAVVDTTHLPTGSFGKVSGSSTLTLKGSSALYNIFTVTSSQLHAAKSLHITVPSSSLVLVNFSKTSSLSLSWPSTTLTGTSASNVLYNFYGTSKLSITGGTILGTILAPQTALTLGKAHLTGGQIVAESIVANGFTTSCGSYIGNKQCSWISGQSGDPYIPA